MSVQAELFPGAVLPRFDGPNLTKSDHERLASQMERIKALMLDGRWRTLEAISKATDTPQASTSAQLRHLRKPRFGYFTVERQYLGNGLYQYRVIV